MIACRFPLPAPLIVCSPFALHLPSVHVAVSPLFRRHTTWSIAADLLAHFFSAPLPSILRIHIVSTALPVVPT